MSTPTAEERLEAMLSRRELGERAGLIGNPHAWLDDVGVDDKEARDIADDYERVLQVLQLLVMMVSDETKDIDKDLIFKVLEVQEKL